ncbi:MAG: DNA (cytosine-5-)-methyltransferase [Rhodospirillales bacterium]|nr:DNA (cytosine-5-)-methyltransferase [Rhodospirillales bacterium]
MTTQKLRVLDLFSGIGGFSLGLERAGFETAAFCEIEPYCREILQKRWPDVPIFEDVRTLDKAALKKRGISKINVICGGFPCQDISPAGKGEGIAGKRSGLWSEFARLIGELKPRYVLIENVSMLRSRGLNVVLDDLHRLGYDAEWHCIPASAIGAPHQRDRIWIVAWPRRKKYTPLPLNVIKSGQWHIESGQERVTQHIDDEAAWKKRIGALGNAVVPQIPQLLGYAIQKHRGLQR